MITINSNSDLATWITILHVHPEKDDELVDILVRVTKSALEKALGFVSASIHVSRDGTRVLFYTQWQSRMTFDAMVQGASLVPYMQEALQIAEVDPNFYEVAAVFEARVESS